MIKIVSGYTNPGGSTIALINLTNRLNEAGYETLMIGPHRWFLDKCNSRLVGNELTFNKKDNLIFHFIEQKKRPNAEKVILTCHEKWWFKVGQINQYWDELVFLHDEHRKYHSDYTGKYSIIPNLKERLIKRDKTDMPKIAGVIGSIEDRKQTHVSIERALKDECDIIYIFGSVGDPDYYNQYVSRLIDGKTVIHHGYEDKKQKIYDKLQRVYHSSKGEVACLIKDECHSTGTQFFGNEETENKVFEGTNEEIIEMWKNVLEL